MKLIIDDYYNILNDDNKKLFDRTIKKEKLYKLGNYYYFEKKDIQYRDTYVILINSSNKIYYFHANW